MFHLIGFGGSGFLGMPAVLGGGPIAFNCGGHPRQLLTISSPPQRAAHDANKERRQSGLIVAIGVADPR
jgi:hypothetical protein